LEILLGIDARRLIRSGLLAVLFDHELLLGDLLVQRIDARRCGCDIGARLLERGLVVPRIDAREHFASRDHLVVVDRHIGKIARHLGADQDRMRLHISVIGRDQKPACPPVVIAVTCSPREEQQCRGRDQQLLLQ
jgi:hypothetical protein